jgi:hypothetical protein
VAPWTFNIKFPYDTQFTFEPLMFATREDVNLELLTQGLAPKHLTSLYVQASYLLASSSTSSSVCSGLNPYAGPYHRTAKTIQGIPIGATIFQLSARTLSSLHRQRPLIKTQLMITLRSGEAPVGTLPMKVASSSWWLRPERLHRIAPADILPSGDWKHRLPEHPAIDWPKI